MNLKNKIAILSFSPILIILIIAIFMFVFLNSLMNEIINKKIQGDLEQTIYSLQSLKNNIEEISISLSNSDRIKKIYLKNDLELLDEILDSRAENLKTDVVLILDKNGYNSKHNLNLKNDKIFQSAVNEKKTITSFYQIDFSILKQLNESENQKISIIKTEQSYKYNSLELKDSLGIISISPMLNQDKEIISYLLIIKFLNKNLEIVDHLQTMINKTLEPFNTKSDVTLFLGPVRVTTTVRNTNKERAIGTIISQPVGIKILKEKKEFFSTAFVVKENYISGYSPIFNIYNQVIGSAYVGIPEKPLILLKNMIIFYCTLFFFIIFTICLFIFKHLKRTTINPLKNLHSKLEGISQDSINEKINFENSDFEIREINHTLNNLLKTIKNKTDELIKLNLSLEEKVQHRTQELFLLNEELQSSVIETQKATKSKSEFLANMSHEIRTPLNGIIGLTSIIRKKEQDKDKLDKLNKITTSANHLLNLLNSILDYSKIEANKLILNFEDVYIYELVDELFSIVQCKAIEKKINLEFHSEIKKNAILHTDKLRISQILLNILSNAIKFTENGKVILKIFIQNNYLFFEIQDTGIGMSEEMKAKLFNPFEQEDASVTRKYGGTGLGLSLSKKIADLLNFKIQVISSKNQGSSFIIDTQQKISYKQIENIIPEHTIKNNIKNLNILIAEDEDINYEILNEFLTVDLKQTVCRACNGLEAVKMSKKQKFDLIFMDQQMPILNGLDAAHIILTEDESINKTTPIYALTANAFQEDKENSLKVGIKKHLTKPINFSEIEEIVSEVSSVSFNTFI